MQGVNRALQHSIGRGVGRAAGRAALAIPAARRVTRVAVETVRAHRDRITLLSMRQANPNASFWTALARAGSGQALVLGALRAANADPEFWRALNQAGGGRNLVAAGRRLVEIGRLAGIAFDSFAGSDFIQENMPGWSGTPDCGWGFSQWSNCAEAAANWTSERVDLSGTVCAFACGGLGFQGGRPYLIWGWGTSFGPGLNIGFATKEYQNRGCSLWTGSAPTELVSGWYVTENMRNRGDIEFGKSFGSASAGISNLHSWDGTICKETPW